MTETSSGAMQVDPALVRQLAELLDDTRLTEIEVQDGDRRIRVARNVAMAAAVPPVAIAAAPMLAPQAAPATVPDAPVPAAPAAPADPAKHPGAIRSPMVGTAYLSSAPGAKQFVSVGDTVAAGATLCIIEAMKVMNPIVSPRAGTVSALFVDNAQPVEFDQPLAIVE